MTANVYSAYADSARTAEPENGPPPPPYARPLYTGVPRPPAAATPPKRDPLAVGSAVCGFTGFVPVITQLIGLALGVAALLRIRRARRAGVELGGQRHAIAGVVMNGFTLVGWIVLASAFAVVGNSLSQTSGHLTQLLSMH